eukprot:4048728-Amphidinium_carterae.1
MTIWITKTLATIGSILTMWITTVLKPEEVVNGPLTICASPKARKVPVSPPNDVLHLVTKAHDVIRVYSSNRCSRQHSKPR